VATLGAVDATQFVFRHELTNTARGLLLGRAPRKGDLLLLQTARVTLAHFGVIKDFNLLHSSSSKGHHSHRLVRSSVLICYPGLLLELRKVKLSIDWAVANLVMSENESCQDSCYQGQVTSRLIELVHLGSQGAV
jgi:hypothetical protein